MSPEQGAFDDVQASSLEMAYVLFMDIVGYSRMPTDVQRETLNRLQKCVRSGNEFRKALKQQRLISLPTGDGMALAFFTDPESCVRCAVETTRALKGQEAVPLRMGMHAGPVYRVADINANQNVAGEGINIAQRVMDCGDAGHILVSKSLADVLRQLTGWMGALQDLGEVSVKHGVKVHVYNLLVEGAGNSNKPEKFGKSGKPGARSSEERANWKLWTAAAAAILSVGGLIAWRMRPVYAYRPKIAVLGFNDQQNSDETAWVSTSLSEDLTTELESSEKVVTIPGESVSRMMKDLRLEKETSYSESTMKKMHAYLDCDYVIYGSYYDIGKEAGGRVQLNVRMQNAKTGETLAAFPESGTELTLADLAARVGAELRTKLSLPNPSVAQAEELQSERPSTPAAAKLYAKGLASFWKYDLIGAAQFFEEVIKVDPTFALAHAELAEVWMRQGYDEKAKEEAGKAKALSTHLGRESKLRVEAGFQEASSDWDNAAESYKALWTFVRERPEYAYRAADVQIRGGKAVAALATLAALRKQPGEMANRPVIDLREAEAYEALTNFKNEASSANTAAQKAHTLGARMLEAEALWRECVAQANLANAESAAKACQQSVEIAEAMHDDLIVARAKSNLGRVATAQGNTTEALALHRQALEHAQAVGSRRDISGALTNMGFVLSVQGDHSGAMESYQKALQVAREIDDKALVLALLNDLATEAQMTGKLSDALSLYKQSLETAQSIHAEGDVARAENNIGVVLSLQGDVREALQYIQSAIQKSETISLKSDQASFLYALGDTELAMGDLAAAEKSYQTGFELAKQISDKPNTALGQVSLGGLFLQRGKASDALDLGNAAATEFHAENSNDAEALSRNLIANSLLALGKIDDAKKELKTTSVLAPQDAGIKLGLEITEARVQIRNGNQKEAKRNLDQAVAEAKRMGDRVLEFEARLGMGEIGLYGGDKRAAKALLQNVEREAAQIGFKGYESRAKSFIERMRSS
jgi:eukaryotic-like serine/threonine-protein kinase